MIYESRRLPSLCLCMFVLALSTTACAVVQSLSFERPGIDLREIQLTGVGLSGGSLNLVLDIHNPNDYTLRTLRVQTAIDIEDTHFGEVELEREFTLRANDTTRVEIPMSFTWSGVGAAARGLLQRGSVSYVMDSKVLVDTPLGEQTLDFRNRGTVPLKQILD